MKNLLITALVSSALACPLVFAAEESKTKGNEAAPSNTATTTMEHPAATGAATHEATHEAKPKHHKKKHKAKKKHHKKAHHKKHHEGAEHKGQGHMDEHQHKTGTHPEKMSQSSNSMVISRGDSEEDREAERKEREDAPELTNR